MYKLAKILVAGDTSPVAAIITGSIFGIIFIIVIVGIIILAIMCLRNRGKGDASSMKIVHGSH